MIPSNLLPEGSKWFVAGGWAACPALAQDMDVWVLADNVHETRRRILEHLREEGFNLFEQEDDIQQSFEVYEHVCSILKVAEVRIRRYRPRIHVMVTDASSIMELLHGFDISTHQIAISPEQGVVTGPHWTPLNERPWAFRENVNTPKRMAKLLDRYGWSGTESATQVTGD